jgi:ABC-2 type transport system ATP-binding protein
VQSVCDRVGIIREGRLITTERIETLTSQQFLRIRLTFRAIPPQNIFTQDGINEERREGGSIIFEVQQNLDELMRRASKFDIINVETLPVTLEEIFLAYYGRNGANHDQLT